MAAAPEKRRKRPSAGSPAVFSQVLETRLREAPPTRKGERTKARLKASAAKVLERTGYLDMRVSDVCDQADVGLATFYLYFENKAEITRAVLIDFLDHIGDTRAT